ncbi:MAG TPA: hypothetical protein EYP59_22630, partial [Thiotrichaceae bacterium]|nr:hypothetical protein [Thiotrichaceae bacterium]
MLRVSAPCLGAIYRREASRLYKSCLCFGDAMHRISTNRVCASETRCLASLQIVSVLRRREASRLYKSRL